MQLCQWNNAETRRKNGRCIGEEAEKGQSKIIMTDHPPRPDQHKMQTLFENGFLKSTTRRDNYPEEEELVWAMERVEIRLTCDFLKR